MRGSGKGESKEGSGKGVRGKRMDKKEKRGGAGREAAGGFETKGWVRKGQWRQFEARGCGTWGTGRRMR